MTSTTTPQTPVLSLDPGPKPRRGAKLTCRHIIWALFILCCITASYFGFLIVRTIARGIKFPHRHLLQDLSVPYNPSDVVRPLIDSNQTFDIVATVWLRRDVPQTNDTVETDADNVEALTGSTKLDAIPVQLTEEPIFSETVFRGLRLRDKLATTNVNLSIPTGVFKNADLWSYDLRATFVLVPNDPSPLMNAVNYTSWIPASAQLPPMRPSHANEDRSLIDKIVDSYGILVPMLEFHPVPTKCEGGDLGASASGDDTEDDNNDNWDDQTSTQPPQSSPLTPFRSTKGSLAAEAHPYVVTRTHIRTVDMTSIFNRKAYDYAHLKLCENACGTSKSQLSRSFSNPSWTTCMDGRLYGANGNLETRIKLRTTSEGAGAKTTQWLYAPYMDYSFHASGPLDLTRVPVSREICPNGETPDAPLKVEDRDTMNVTWNIAFSGISPAKLVTQSNLALAFLSIHEGRNMSATEYDLYKEQDKHIYIQGLFGHRLENDGHPRLHLLMYSLAVYVTLAALALDFVYWYTRSSTVGISIYGTAIIVTEASVAYALGVVSGTRGAQLSFFGWITAALFNIDILFYISSIWMLKTITRAELQWSSWIRFATATHAERASRRVDARTPWYAIVAAYVIFAAIHLTFQHFDLYVVFSPGISPPSASQLEKMIAVLRALLVEPAFAVGKGLQLVMNFRTQQFAGTYKLKAYMDCFSAGCLMIVLTPNVFGSSQVQDGLQLSIVVDFILAVGSAWQARCYPYVKQEEMEE